MKKTILMAGAVLMSAVCMGQIKDVKRAQSLVMQEVPNFAEARQLIEGAKTNPETMNDANTWYVAGLVGYQESEAEYNKRYLGQTADFNVIGAAQKQSYLDWQKADELAGVLVQDKKGNMVMDKKNILIRKNIAQKMLDYWNNQGLLMYAGSFYENKDFDQTYELYKMYISIPKLPVMQDEKTQTKMLLDTVYQDLCFSAGQLAYSAAKYQDAADIFAELVKGDFKAVSAGEYLYSCYLSTGDSAEAYAVMDECIQRFPREERFVQARINAYVADKDYVNAVLLLDKAIAMDKQPQYFNSKGSILTILGQYEDAINAFNEGISLDANNSDLYTGLGYVYVEQANRLNETAASMSDAEYKKVRRELDDIYKKALPIFQKAYQLNSDNYDCARALKSLYYRLGMQEEYNAMQ